MAPLIKIILILQGLSGHTKNTDGNISCRKGALTIPTLKEEHLQDGLATYDPSWSTLSVSCYKVGYGKEI
jgi:hypothetical protein